MTTVIAWYDKSITHTSILPGLAMVSAGVICCGVAVGMNSLALPNVLYGWWLMPSLVLYSAWEQSLFQSQFTVPVKRCQCDNGYVGRLAGNVAIRETGKWV